MGRDTYAAQNSFDKRWDGNVLNKDKIKSEDKGEQLVWPSGASPWQRPVKPGSCCSTSAFSTHAINVQ